MLRAKRKKATIKAKRQKIIKKEIGNKVSIVKNKTILDNDLELAFSSYKYKPKSKKNKQNEKKKNKRKILLPEQLLKKAKSISKNPTFANLQKAIKIYDIDDEINFLYLQQFKKLDSKNYKYIYTLCYENRKKIIKKHNLKKKTLKVESKILFYEFINFLINKYKANSKSAENSLNYYNLENFETFIIQINEGTEELKFYYFMYLIFKWLSVDKIKCIDSLSYFRNFFKNEDNLNKIDTIFFIIFRIDMFYFSAETLDNDKVLSIKTLVDEDIEDKKLALNLIKDKIEEKLDEMEIEKDTVLTLKKENFRFKPLDYYFDIRNREKDQLLKSIIKKVNMSYDYCLQEKLNYFDKKKKKLHSSIS
jgi:hypothetical protein